MPLKCVSSAGNALYAFNFESQAWRDLAARNRLEKHLAMACCGSSVVLKTSHCGTRFFAHLAREGSPCPRETEEHLQAKDLIARTVTHGGWTAETEVALDSRTQVADVLATKGRRRLAFEVQWTRQQEADTRRRHQAYKQKGIRALWLFKQADYPLERATPAFRLSREEDRQTFSVWVWPKDRYLGKSTEPAQVAELSTFIAGAMAGRLKWGPAYELIVPVVGYGASARCRRGHATKLLTGIEIAIGRVLPGHGNAMLQVEHFGERPEFLRSAAAKALLDANGLAIHFGLSNSFNQSMRNGRLDPRRYAYPCCARCGEIAGSWQTLKLENTVIPRFELPLKLTRELVADLPGLARAMDRWWLAPNQSSEPD